MINSSYSKLSIPFHASVMEMQINSHSHQQMESSQMPSSRELLAPLAQLVLLVAEEKPDHKYDKSLSVKRRIMQL